MLFGLPCHTVFLTKKDGWSVAGNWQGQQPDITRNNGSVIDDRRGITKLPIVKLKMHTTNDFTLETFIHRQIRPNRFEKL